jgi:hypothetical protein
MKNNTEKTYFCSNYQNVMKSNMQRILGISMILLTWVFWGIIIVIPFLKLGVKTSAILISGLLVATNLFWVGIFLVGKEYAQRFQIMKKLKKLFHH